MTSNNCLVPCSSEHNILKAYRQGEKRLGYPLTTIAPLFKSEYSSSGRWFLQLNNLGIAALGCLDRGILYDIEENVGMVEQTFMYWENIFDSPAVSADAIEVCGRMPKHFFKIQKLAVDFVLHSDRNQQWFIRTC